jgi:HTH-type transcriptional regulator / antitoxin HigA
MKVKVIKTKKEHAGALTRVYQLMQAEPRAGSAELEELELLALLVAAYEDKHLPVPPPDPIEAIKFRIEQLGLKESDLGKLLGSRQRRSDIFSGRRKLSLSMIRSLHRHLRIPAEILIREYKVELS